MRRIASTSTSVPRLRADARQNRELLVTAADEVFAELGMQAPLDLIAERAGVSRATLFRNFSDRNALIGALSNRAFEEIEEHAVMAHDDPAALLSLLRFMCECVVDRAPMIQYWRSLDPNRPDVHQAFERMFRIFDAPLSRAIAAGVCRKDLTLNDISLFLLMLGGASYGDTVEARSLLTRRAWTLIQEGIVPVCSEKPRATRK